MLIFITYQFTNKMNKIGFSFLCCLLSISVFSQYNFTELDKKLDDTKKQLGGDVVAMIYKDGKVIYQKTIGEFKPNTQAPIASCSKWLTAAIVMRFVDEGKLNLDDKVSTYLPIFEKYGKKYITIRHCLSHQTGIQQEKNNLLKLLTRKKFETLEEEVNDFASAKEIDFNAGSGFHYGNIGLNIAARVLEVITRRSFEQIAQEKLFRPLMMRQTTFRNDQGGAPNPSGGAQSSAGDYMNFLSMILNKGMFNGNRILSEVAIAEMQKEQISLDKIKYAPAAAEGYTYGLGEWIMAKNSAGVTTVVSSPGLFGTWPMVDNCRGYALIIFVKNFLGEQKKNLYEQMIASVNSQMPQCK